MQSSMRIRFRFTLGAFFFFFYPSHGHCDQANRRSQKCEPKRPRYQPRRAHVHRLPYSCRRTRINRPRDGEPRSLSVAATAVAAATTAVQHYTEPTAKNDHVSSSPRSPAITTEITEITRRKAKNSWLLNNNGVVDVCWGTREQTTSFSNSGKHEGEEEAAQWGKKRWRFGTQMAPNGAAARAPGHDVARDVFY